MHGSAWVQQCAPADVREASTLVTPVCELAVPVDGPRGDAQIAFPSNGSARVGGITPSSCINDPSLLRGVSSCTHPNDLLDVLTALHKHGVVSDNWPV